LKNFLFSLRFAFCFTNENRKEGSEKMRRTEKQTFFLKELLRQIKNIEGKKLFFTNHVEI